VGVRLRSVVIEEVLKKPLSALGEDRFGVKLHPFYGPAPVAHAHNDIVGSPRADAEIRGQSVRIYDQRVVAHGRERVFQRSIDGPRIMEDFGHLTVHDLRRADDLASEGCPNALVSQADTEDRGRLTEAADHVAGDAGLFGSAWAGGDDDLTGFEPFDLFQGNFVVPKDLHLCSQLAEIVKEIVGERVVVVD